MKLNTIAQIKAHQFAGNAYSDQKAFNAIDEFVQDVNNSVADRAEALRIVSDVGMGCGRDEHLTDEQVIESYMRAFD